MKQARWAWLGLALLALLAGPAAGGLFDRFGDASQERILNADQAFQVAIHAVDALSIEARWLIAPGYYLYRNKFQLSVLEPSGIQIASFDLPAGEPKDDPYFGRQAVFHQEAVIRAVLKRDTSAAQAVRIKADYQGCAEVGVCYPPLTQTATVTLAALPTDSPERSPPAEKSTETPAPAKVIPPIARAPMATSSPDLLGTPPAASEPEQDRLARLLHKQRFWAIPAFFGFGVLLAFTPCVFPMVPILSSLIIGQGARLTRWKAVLLSLTYVLAMAITYTLAGLIAAVLGQNLQVWFQNPWVLSVFSLVFVLLALSLFGLYDLQLPTALQSRLMVWSNRQRGGDYTGVAIMGLLSALIVGPCVAPPLIGALTFITVTGDLLLGGAALFALGLGMGIPLLLIGVSAGHWLPRIGHWMERIKIVFGVLLLAVALWLLERILPAAAVMVLWAVLLVVTATYMGALQPIMPGAPAWRTLVKGLGLVLFIHGILLLVGVAAGGREPWQPLRGVLGSIADTTDRLPKPTFQPVKTVAEVDAALRSANRPVLLDFYADWCVSCKEMERSTFSDPDVQTALTGITLLRADVTANDAADRDLLQRFGIIGPPTLMFFGVDGRERREYRIVGFMEAEPFHKRLQTLLADHNRQQNLGLTDQIPDRQPL